MKRMMLLLLNFSSPFVPLFSPARVFEVALTLVFVFSQVITGRVPRARGNLQAETRPPKEGNERC